MNPFTVTHNFNQALNLLQQLSSRYADLTPAMRKIAGTLADESEQAFADEADPATGQPWPALSESYLAQNPERASGQMLQLSGQLTASLTTDFGNFWAQIGSNKPYAAIHQLGGTPDMSPGTAAIPARAYMGLSAQGEMDIIDILKSYLVD